MAVKILPDAAYLRECFTYDAETGGLLWNYRPRAHFGTQRGFHQVNARFAGRAAGRIGGVGHRVVGVGGAVYLVHRVIWKMVTGQEPSEIDHRNRNRSDNRWGDLRAATRRNNTQNKGTRSDSRTGVKGVRRDSRSGRFGADICFEGRRHWLGTFATVEAAHAAYCAAARVHFGEFWTDGA